MSKRPPRYRLVTDAETSHRGIALGHSCRRTFGSSRPYVAAVLVVDQVCADPNACECSARCSCAKVKRWYLDRMSFTRDAADERRLALRGQGKAAIMVRMEPVAKPTTEPKSPAPAVGPVLDIAHDLGIAGRQYLDAVAQVASRARKAILPYFRKRGLDFKAGNGTWFISDKSGRTYEDAELPQHIQDLLLAETECRQPLGFWIEDINHPVPRRRS